jgi:hypothetical protein
MFVRESVMMMDMMMCMVVMCMSLHAHNDEISA